MKDNKVPSSVPLGAEVDEEFASFVQYLNTYCQETITGNLLGRLLTLIDASIDASPKTESLKSLIKQECWASYNDIWQKNCRLDRDYNISSK